MSTICLGSVAAPQAAAVFLTGTFLQAGKIRKAQKAAECKQSFNNQLGNIFDRNCMLCMASFLRIVHDRWWRKLAPDRLSQMIAASKTSTSTPRQSSPWGHVESQNQRSQEATADSPRCNGWPSREGTSSALFGAGGKTGSMAHCGRTASTLSLYRSPTRGERTCPPHHQLHRVS